LNSFAVQQQNVDEEEEEEMYLLDQTTLGIAILCLLGMLVIVKQVATGSILNKPKGNLLVQLVNIFNLFFLLVVNPLAAILLITGQLAMIAPIGLSSKGSWGLLMVELVGMVLYVTGYLLMAGALITLGRNYQLGGSTPRSEDQMVVRGPFPVILKGWFERVFAYGDAYALTAEGWHGEAKGRVPLLHHEKALVISTTLFREEDYKADWEAPMTRIIDDWGLRYPGVKNVEHVYFYGVPVVDDETRRGYLERSYRLGKEFAS
jgi:hypothetical protein